MGAVERDLSHALGLFARTARSRPLYSPNNQVRIKMMNELVRAFARLFEDADQLTLSVRPDAFVYGETAVLKEEADPSIPYLFFRDGVRRIELSRGIEQVELEVLLDATAHGITRRGFDDDVVSTLWRHQLEHVHYVTVDTTIVDAEPGEWNQTTSDLDTQIDALIHSIYGSAIDGDGPKRSVHIDASELTAKGIADALGSVDEMAPGFYPPKHFLLAPSYGEQLVQEARDEEDAAVMELAAGACAEALARAHDPADFDSFGNALLSMYDAALIEARFELLQRFVGWFRTIAEAHSKGRELLEMALSEARVRQLASLAPEDSAMQAEVLAFLERCGPSIVPSVLALIPSLPDPRQRRAYSELVNTVGTEDIEPIRDLLGSEQGAVAAEALHLLAEMGKMDRRAVRAAIVHGKPQVRLMALQVIERLDRGLAREVLLELLDDREPRVRMEAVKLAERFDDPAVKQEIETIVSRDEFENATPAVKEAFLRAYVQLAGRTALDRLDEMICASDRRLVRRQVEELSAAAVSATASLKTARSIEMLKKACLSKNKKVRELARSELEKMREALE